MKNKEMVTLWKYNKATGYWCVARDCAHDTAADWLKIFQQDEPGEIFKLSVNRPRNPK